MDEATEYLKSKGMIVPPCNTFEITGDFGKVDLAKLLTEFKENETGQST